jgi:hypothetical protein
LDLRQLRRALLALAILALVAPTPASAARSPGYNLTSHQAIEIARTDPKVAAEEAKWGHLSPSATTKDATWQVGFYKGDRELVLVVVDDATGAITESWTGYQVAWQMARGYPGAFGRKLNAPYVWLPLCALFICGLWDWRRWRRWAHVDLAMLLAFGVSHYFFNRADIGVSVPLVYPVLLYLLVRMLWIGFRGRGEGLRPSLSVGWLALGVIFLLAFRVALNVADSNVIDVGYSGVVGGDRAIHGKPMYGEGAFPSDNASGDTYGPANYYAYVPFDLAWPWSGSWDSLPAAHAASIAFDLLAAAGLFLLGRRIRPGPAGTRLGVILAYAWAAYPYTAFALESNSNDTLVAVLVIGALLLISSAVGRGVMAALAALTKFAPFALAPLLAVGLREERRPADEASSDARAVGGTDWRGVAIFSLAFAVAAGLLLAWPATNPGLSTFWHRTISFQANRNSPFSVWGQTDLGWLHTTVEALTVALAVAVAFVPRRRDLRQVAALGAAVMVATELCADHWFYLYIPWFFPLVAVALALAPVREVVPVEAKEQVEEGKAPLPAAARA